MFLFHPHLVYPLMANDHSRVGYVSVVVVIKNPALTGSASPPSPGPQRVLGWRKSETRIPALYRTYGKDHARFPVIILIACIHGAKTTCISVVPTSTDLTISTYIKLTVVVRDRDHPCCAICLFLLHTLGVRLGYRDPSIPGSRVDSRGK